MNKVHDHRALEREYITTQVSLRDLCRRHGISAHSSIVVQAQKGAWQEKHEQRMADQVDELGRHPASRLR